MSEANLVALAAVCVLLVLCFIAHELVRLARFFSSHKQLFVPEPKPAHHGEVDDPLLWALSRCRLIRPTSRLRGDYEPPEHDNEEPQRTERLLSRPFSIWSHAGAGDEYSSLATLWLCDVGSGRGTFYQIVKASVQV